MVQYVCYYLKSEVLGTGHLILNHWLIFSREDEFFYSPYFVVACGLCAWLKPCELSLIHIRISVVVLIQCMFRQSYWWDFIGILWHPLMPQSHSIPFVLLDLSIFMPPFPRWTQNLSFQSCLQVYLRVGSGLHNYTWRLVRFFCNGLPLLQSEVYLMRGEGCTYL